VAAPALSRDAPGSRRATGPVAQIATFVPSAVPKQPQTGSGLSAYSSTVTMLVPARRLATSADAAMVAPAIVYFAIFVGVGAWYPYQSVFLASRGLDLASIGLLLALGAVVSLVAAPVWGAIADRAGIIHGPLLLTSLVAASGAAWLAVAPDPLTIAAALALLSVGTAGIIPLADTRTIELAGESRERFARARAFGSAAFIVGAIVTGVLVTGRSPDALFVLFAPMMLVTGIAAWRLLAPRPGDAARASRRSRPRFSVAGFLRLLGRSGMLALLVGTTLIWTSVGAVMTFIGIHVTDMGGELAIVGLISATGAVIEVPIMLAFPVLARRFGAERLLVVGAVAFALRAALWSVAPSPIAALLISPLGGVGFAFFYVGMVTFVSRSVPAEAQATAQGVYSGMTFSLGTVIGSAVAGVAAPVLGLPGLFAAAAVGTLLGALVVGRAIAVSRQPTVVPRPVLAGSR
jgi:MFS transporter, PPP family, 3-phenylpropionic acid transporter